MTSPADPPAEESQPVLPRSAAREEASPIDSAVAAERVGESVVLVHLRTNKIYELNATAGRIFELLRSGAGRRAIVTTLTAEFAIDEATVTTELDELLAALRSRQIVK